MVWSWSWTADDQRAYEHSRTILAEYGVTHPRARFDLYTCPLTRYGDDYGYVVDDHVAQFGNDRWWPFNKDYVRVAPDLARYSWYCEHLGLYSARQAHLLSMSDRVPPGDHVATARLTVHFPKPRGGGALSLLAEVAVDLRSRTVMVLHDDVTGDQRTQAEAKGHKLVDLLVRTRQRRLDGGEVPRYEDDAADTNQ